MVGNGVKPKAFPEWLLGVSFAATWTWAVSVLVGMALLREQGIIPFFVWFTANTAAIPVFGWASRKYPNLWNQTRRLPMRAIMTVMLVFTFWINMTGIVTMGDTLQWLSSDINKGIAIVTGLFLWAMVARNGIRWSVISDRVQWWALYGAVIVALIITVIQDGFTLDTSLKWGSYSSPRDWLLGLWTVPLLLTNPFIDGTFWHRARYADSMRPYWWGFAMFFSYLGFVALLGLLGPTLPAMALLFVVVYFASNSTMDSTASALQLTAGKKLGIILGLAMIVLWIPIASVGLLDAWIAMFVWFPFIFAWQVVTYVLERRGILSVPSQESLAARDALPLIQGEKEVVRVGPAAITPERTREA
jgi:hypothetical protein